MGGVDKALVRLDGQPLLAHAIARLSGQCSALAISANGDAARFASFGLPVVADDIPGFAGPLAGVLAGLEHAGKGGFGLVVTLPVDTPFAPHDLVARLDEARSGAAVDISVAESGGRRHHAVALWPVSIAGDIRRSLIGCVERGVARFSARYKTATAEWPTAPFDPFLNVNTPDDVVAANAALRAASGVDG